MDNIEELQKQIRKLSIIQAQAIILITKMEGMSELEDQRFFDEFDTLRKLLKETINEEEN